MTTIVRPTNLFWNYECIRDFCGSFANWQEEEDTNTRRNKGLMYFLPTAINKQSISDNSLKDCIMADDNDEDFYIDYRSDINIKSTIIDCLTSGRQPSTEELVAILDLIYIDMLPVDVEMEADRLIKEAEKNTVKVSAVHVQPGSLAEFALNHGCDYMDMNTMTIYHPL